MIDLNKEFYLVDKHYKGGHPSAGGLEIVKADDFNQLDLNDIWCPYCGTKGFVLASFNNETEGKVAQGALLATPESHEYMRSLISNFFKSRKVNGGKIRTSYLYVVLDNGEADSDDRIEFFTENEDEIEDFKEVNGISDESFESNYKVEEILLSKGLMERLVSVAGGKISWIN